MAFEGGWTRVKLYFMLGLRTETEEDIRGIADLSNKIAALFFETVPKEKRTGQVQIVASTSFFLSLIHISSRVHFRLPLCRGSGLK